MSDQANVEVKFGVLHPPVYFYAHSGGSDLDVVMAAALRRGKNRWDNPHYLARIIFCEMVKSRVMDEIGFGIGSYIPDNSSNHSIISICPLSLTVCLKYSIFDDYWKVSDQEINKMSFDDFIEFPGKLGYG